MSNTGVNFRKPKVSSACSNFSKKSDKTTKSYKPIKKNDFNIEQNNPAYIYYKEILRSQEYLRKRNQTAKLNNKRIFLQNVINNMQKINKLDNNTNYNNFKKTQSKKVTQSHQKIINQYKDPKNPYSTFWPNHILDSRFKMELGIKGFINGIPILNIKKKKINYKINNKENNNKKLNNNNNNKNNQKEIKIKNSNNFSKDNNNDDNNNNNNLNENNNENNNNNKEEIEEDFSIDEKLDNIFNTNQKDFFKFRKDIKEEPENEEDDENKKEEEINSNNEENTEDKKNHIKNIKSKSEINTNRENNNTKKDIQFKEIFKYFKFKNDDKNNS